MLGLLCGLHCVNEVIVPFLKLDERAGLKEKGAVPGSYLEAAVAGFLLLAAGAMHVDLAHVGELDHAAKARHVR